MVVLGGGAFFCERDTPVADVEEDAVTTGSRTKPPRGKTAPRVGISSTVAACNVTTAVIERTSLYQSRHLLGTRPVDFVHQSHYYVFDTFLHQSRLQFLYQSLRTRKTLTRADRTSAGALSLTREVLYLNPTTQARSA